ncbi:nuclear transport factor 2 family protein [Streptomyces sp. A1499]|uniref:nuclear transport factor 2 family protein n=1 Tax=Streptomyces sp. A1499 TaxID=2563104 RepID=UPI00109EB8CD|nr:nuclear transport factor 2 family protein [Streptomyces sp. A1499]THC51933.1 nuclear transport factor 2 family protein [Streptomyces sp. A1499]
MVTKNEDLGSRHALAAAFQRCLAERDWVTLRTLFTEDATWTLPGDNEVSGQVEGADAVVERARLIAGFGLRFDLLHVLVSRDNMALSLHNTAERDGVVLDEYLATVCRLRDCRIASVETYLSDVPGMNAFFAQRDQP